MAARGLIPAEIINRGQKNKVTRSPEFINLYDSASSSDSESSVGSECGELSFTKRRNIKGENKLLLKMAVPASKPPAQLPAKLRRGKKEDMDEVVAKLTTVHSTFNGEKTATHNRHNRIVTRLSFTKRRKSRGGTSFNQVLDSIS